NLTSREVVRRIQIARIVRTRVEPWCPEELNVRRLRDDHGEEHEEDRGQDAETSRHRSTLLQRCGGSGRRRGRRRATTRCPTTKERRVVERRGLRRLGDGLVHLYPVAGAQV